MNNLAYQSDSNDMNLNETTKANEETNDAYSNLNKIQQQQITTDKLPDSNQRIENTNTQNTLSHASNFDKLLLNKNKDTHTLITSNIIPLKSVPHINFKPTLTSDHFHEIDSTKITDSSDRILQYNILKDSSTFYNVDLNSRNQQNDIESTNFKFDNVSNIYRQTQTKNSFNYKEDKSLLFKLKELIGNSWLVNFLYLKTQRKDSIGIRRDSVNTDGHSQTLTFDEMISKIGQLGPYQFFLLVIFCSSLMIEVMINVMFVFTAAVPNHYCSGGPIEQSPLFSNLSEMDRSLLLRPHDENNVARLCEMYDVDYSNWTESELSDWLLNENYTTLNRIPCNYGWTYDQTYYKDTFSTEYNLVCDKQMEASLPFSLVTVGQATAGFAWGFIIDRFGRKWPYRFATLTMVLITLGCSFISSMPLYLAIMMIMGVCSNCTYYVTATMAIEISGVKYRGHTSISINYFWALGNLLLTMLAYFVRSWRQLQMTIGLVSLAVVSSLFFTIESPRWLYTKNRKDEANIIMKKFSKSNKKEFPPNCDVIVPDALDSNVSVMLIFRNRILLKMTLAIFFIWFSASFVYFGVSLLLPTMTGNPHLNFFLSSIIEFPGILFAQFAIAYLGRKKPLTCIMVLCGLGLYAAVAAPIEIGWIRILLAMFAKFCVMAAWSISVCYTSELYPTVLRGRGMFMCSAFGNAGSITAPLIVLLSRSNGMNVPLLIFATFAIAAGFTCLTLPETNNKPLNDTCKTIDTLNIQSQNNDAILYDVTVNRSGQGHDNLAINI